jgi:hypothetical protein
MTPAYNTMPSINFTIYKRPIYRKNILKNNEPKKSSKSDEKFSQHLMRPDHAPKFLLIPRRPPISPYIIADTRVCAHITAVRRTVTYIRKKE